MGAVEAMLIMTFFYSDIDRAWFNFNEFNVEVAKLGVPMNAKLTRREWSLI